METLNQLIKLVTQKRIKKIELFDENNRNKSSNYYKLFDGIHNQKYHSDYEAAQDIYQCKPSEKKYLILKTRLKQKLLNTLFFVDVEKNKDIASRDVLEQQLTKSLYHAKILLMNNSSKLAIPIVEKMYKQAQNGELTLISFECAEILMKHYSSENNYKGFLMFKSALENLEQKLFAENKSERMVEEIRVIIQKFKNPKNKISAKTHSYLEEVGKYLVKFNSKKIKNSYLNLKTISSQVQGDYEFALDTLNQKEDFLAKNESFYSENEKKELEKQKMLTFLNLKNFEGGKNYLQFLRKRNETFPNDHNFQLESYYLLLALHTERYTEAAEVFNFITENLNFRRLNNIEKNQYLVFKAYLHYIYKSQKDKAIKQLISNSKVNFKLRDYIDQRPTFDKKKRSVNLAILNSQILFYLEKLDYAGIADCVEYLNDYCRRYPKKDGHYRSEIFINLLKEARRTDFKYYQTNSNTQKLLSELKETPMEYGDGFENIEILPYEKMWEIILEKIKLDRYG